MPSFTVTEKLNKKEMCKIIKRLFTEDYYFDTYSVNAKQKVNNIGILTDIRKIAKHSKI